MTQDYTKNPTTEAAVESAIAKVDSKELICEQCYEINTPIYLYYGNWIEYCFKFILIAPLVFVPTVLWLVFILFVGVLTRGFLVESLPILPFFKFLPGVPYKLKTCPACNAISQMVDLHTRPGKHAMYWHLRKKTGGDFTSADKQSKLSKDQQ